ncbi:unnamed protein product [Owenia fusiformis]|uniref:Uncharacterized protein n=1 Tax=Owenia fusiformis TaxID=6347 RepID=A0A8J1U663_OWEFU|nr:unnamed protein product [Owenia fusiformis]
MSRLKGQRTNINSKNTDNNVAVSTNSDEATNDIMSRNNGTSSQVRRENYNTGRNIDTTQGSKRMRKGSRFPEIENTFHNNQLQAEKFPRYDQKQSGLTKGYDGRPTQRISVEENGEISRRNSSSNNSAISQKDKRVRRKLDPSRLTIMSKGLFKAVAECRFNQVKFLVNCGVKLDSRNDEGFNVLVCALHIEDDDRRDRMFRYLLKRGAECLDVDDKHNKNVLSWACSLGRSKQVEEILREYMGEIDFHVRDKSGRTPLHDAAISGDMSTVKAVLKIMEKYKISVDVSDNMGLTPYLHAKRLGHHEIVYVFEKDSGVCRSQFDTRTFRTASAWERVGQDDRKKQSQHQREQDAAAFKIRGQIPPWDKHKLSLPKLKFTMDDTMVTPSFSDSSSSKNYNLRNPKRYSQNLRQTYPDGTGNNIHLGGKGQGLNTALSILDLAQSQGKGTIADHFVQSTAIESLGSGPASSGHHAAPGGVDLTSMMVALSDQQSSAFRANVKYVRPSTPKQKLMKARQKISTLAILFGKVKPGAKGIKNKGTKTKVQTKATPPLQKQWQKPRMNKASR